MFLRRRIGKAFAAVLCGFIANLAGRVKNWFGLQFAAILI
jgi:hypothetical protein